MTQKSRSDAHQCRRRSVLTLLATPWLAAFPGLGLGAQFPTRPIRIVVGFPPGGSSDAIVRLVAEQLQRQMTATVVVENKPGASGVVAARQLTRAEPDGYTLLYATSSSHAIAPIFDSNIGYDAERDFSPLFLLNRAAMVILARPSLPARSLGELVSLAKQHPDEPLTYGSPGEMSSQNLAMKILAKTLGIRLQHIPYKGSAPALVDLMGGQLDLVIDNVATPLPHIRTGKVIPLVVTASQRIAQLPETPCVGESNINLDLRSWGGLVGPAGLRPEVQERLSKEIEKALRHPEVVAVIEQLGSVPGSIGGDQFRAFIAEEAKQWTDAKEKGII